VPRHRPGSLLEEEWRPHVRVALGAIPGLTIWDQEGGIFRHMNSGIPLTIDVPDGAADLTGIVGPPLLTGLLAGARLELEIKGSSDRGLREQARPRDSQAAWQRFIEAHGGIYTVVGHRPELSLEENIRRARGIVLDAIRDHAEKKRAWAEKRSGGASSG
jgi:hypothetical protein